MQVKDTNIDNRVSIKAVFFFCSVSEGQEEPEGFLSGGDLYLPSCLAP